MMVGTNDMLNSGKLATLEQYEINLRSLADQILAYNSELILMTIPHCIEELLFSRHDESAYEPDGPNGRVDLANAVITQVAAEKNATLVDIFSIFDGRVNMDADSLIKNPANGGGEDGVHPTDEGYELMMDAIYAAIVENDFPIHKIVCFGDSITTHYPDLLYNRIFEGEDNDPNSGVTATVGNVVTFNLGTETLTMWEPDGTMVWETTGIADSYQVEIGPDGNVYLGGYADKVIRVYDAETGNFLNNIAVAASSSVLDLAFSDNADLYVVHSDLFVSKFTLASGYTAQSTFASDLTRKGFSLDFGPDMTGDGVPELYVLDGGESNTGNSIRVFDGTTGVQVNTWVASLANRPWGLVGGSDSRIYVTSRNTNRVVSYAANGTDGQVHGESIDMNFPWAISEGTPGTWYAANRYAVTGTTNAAISHYTDNFAAFEGALVEGPAGSNYTGIAVIPSPYNGDLTFDGKVNLEDIARLSKDWQSVYMMDNLLDIANDWLSGAIE
jgi:lysophospholipase L1-like esterase